MFRTSVSGPLPIETGAGVVVGVDPAPEGTVVVSFTLNSALP
jgi:hypothetical protein